MSVVVLANSEFLQRRVAELLPRFAYRMGDERSFQDGLEQVLREGQIPFQREYVAGPRDRFDFLVEGGIVIEAKVRGSLSPALEQIQRYAARPDVTGVILVTTRYWGANSAAVRQLKGKPIHVVKVRGAAF